jgi:hypothetical protein
MRRSNLATPLQVADDLLEGQVRFRGSLLERGQILGVLRQGGADRLVDQLREAGVGLGRLDAQGAVELGLEVDGGAFLRRRYAVIIAL